MNLADRGCRPAAGPGRDGRVWLDDLPRRWTAGPACWPLSHVEFATGFRNDLDALGELCRAAASRSSSTRSRGSARSRSTSHGRPIDFLAADGHKWLLGPEGAGLLYVRRDWIDRLRPVGVGWHSVVGSYEHSPELDFRLKPNAQRWEGGTFNMAGLQALGASLELLLELGPEAVSARILDRAEAVREVAASAGWRVYGSARPGDRSRDRRRSSATASIPGPSSATSASAGSSPRRGEPEVRESARPRLQQRGRPRSPADRVGGLSAKERRGQGPGRDR